LAALGLDLRSSAGHSGENAGGAEPFSIVKLGRARIEWGSVRQQAVGGIGQLRALIAEKFQNAPGQEKQLAQALATLDQKISQLGPTLDDQVDSLLNAQTPEERKKLAEVARGTLKGFISSVDSDPIIGALDGNEIMPSLAVIAPMRKTLAEIASALG